MPRAQLARLATTLDEIDITCSGSPDTIDGSLNLRCTLGHGCQRVGDRDVAIVMAVDADLDAQRLLGGADALGDFLRQRATVGVMQSDHNTGARVLGGPQRLQGVFGVVLEAVEEVLGIIKHFTVGGLAQGDRVRDHAQVLLQRRTEHLGDVHVPGFADQGDDWRLGRQDRLEAWIVFSAGIFFRVMPKAVTLACFSGNAITF